MLIGKILGIVVGESRVTALGVNLQLKDLGAGISEGWSFISRSEMTRFLPEFNIYFFLPVLILVDLLQQEERLNINRKEKKPDNFYS